jgi:uncharacterized protein YjbJ (UPF0337 family)
MKSESQTWENHWQEIMAKLNEKWGWLNEQDLEKARGDLQQLARIIQQKTGESREAIQAFLDETLNRYAGTMQQAAEVFRQYAGKAAESLQDATDQASESVRLGLRQSRVVVRTHPMESLMTCFGVGIVTGLVVGILAKSR